MSNEMSTAFFLSGVLLIFLFSRFLRFITQLQELFAKHNDSIRHNYGEHMAYMLNSAITRFVVPLLCRTIMSRAGWGNFREMLIEIWWKLLVLTMSFCEQFSFSVSFHKLKYNNPSKRIQIWATAAVLWKTIKHFCRINANTLICLQQLCSPAKM